MISVWYSVADGSYEAAAMKSITDDFTDKFGNVTVELTAIPEAEICRQAENGGREE